VSRRSRRVAAIGLGVALVVLSADAAFAHVEIEPATAEQGAPATLTFSVPNEEPAASTVRIDIQIPAGVRNLTATAKDGWTPQITQASDSTPGEVVWSGGQFGGDSREEFVLQIGAMPASGDEAQFKTIQTYSTGEAVSWIQPPNPDGSEPDRPTPTVKLTPASSSSTSDSSNTPLIVALVIAVIVAIAAVVFVLLRRRRADAPEV